MLDRKIHRRKRRPGQAELRNRGSKADVDRFVGAGEPSAASQADRGRRAQSPGQRGLASRSARPRTPPSARPARTKAAQLREQTHGRCRPSSTRSPPSWTRSTGTIPNLSHPDAPVGADDQANLELFRGKTPLPKFDFKPLDHVELAEKLDLIDFEAGAKVAGHGFYFLKNDAVLLELALQRYARRRADARGLHADDHARPGPQRDPATASATFPAGRRRRSTASRTPT